MFVQLACWDVHFTYILRVYTIKAAVASPAMLAAMATPETVGVALKLIETYGIEISDEVSELA